MIQVSPQRRGYGLGFIHPRSRTMACPGAAQRVLAMQGDADADRISIANRGVGDAGAFFSSVPTWAWALGGGLIGGLVIGAVVFKKKG